LGGNGSTITFESGSDVNVRAGEKIIIGAGTTIKGKFSAKVMDVDYNTTEK
jgi:hypothetical protein